MYRICSIRQFIIARNRELVKSISSRAHFSLSKVMHKWCAVSKKANAAKLPAHTHAHIDIANATRVPRHVGWQRRVHFAISQPLAALFAVALKLSALQKLNCNSFALPFHSSAIRLSPRFVPSSAVPCPCPMPLAQPPRIAHAALSALFCTIICACFC